MSHEQSKGFLKLENIFSKKAACQRRNSTKMKKTMRGGSNVMEVKGWGGDFWQSSVHMWLSFAYVASLQGEGLCKHKQRRGCSWSKEAAPCLPRPHCSKQWIEWRTGLWQRNRHPGSSEKPFFPTFTSQLFQYLPHREASFSTTFVLRRAETAQLPPSQSQDRVWVFEYECLLLQNLYLWQSQTHFQQCRCREWRGFLQCNLLILTSSVYS